MGGRPEPFKGGFDDMKLGDAIRDTPVWRELFNLTDELLRAGEKAQDGGVYMTGLRLSKIIARLGDIDLPVEPKQ
jgi:hypothetical protein